MALLIEWRDIYRIDVGGSRQHGVARVENERETFRPFSKKKKMKSKKGKRKWHFAENERKRKNHKRKRK
jgi:hypothetical protein